MVKLRCGSVGGDGMHSSDGGDGDGMEVKDSENIVTVMIVMMTEIV